MADIRINSLSTTAASTASDDFVAVDGSANGTRKLNAYSPTFGGNLTVSGTGVFSSTVSSYDNSAGGSFYVLRDAGSNRGSYYFGRNNSGTFQAVAQINGSSDTAATTNGVVVISANNGSSSNTEIARFAGATSLTTLAGNLTVSGTGNSSVAGNLGIGTTSPQYSLQVSAPSTASYYPIALSSGVIGTIGNTVGMRFGFTGNTYQKGAIIYESISANGVGKLHFALNATENSSNATLADSKAVLTSTGRLLLATGGVDSGALLQVGTDTTTSAGGIGFGTDTSLYRAAAQSLNLDGSSSPQFSLSVSGTQKARFEAYSDDLYISTLTAGKSIILRSGNAATALTLDSSQNATFAGNITSNATGGFNTFKAQTYFVDKELFLKRTSVQDWGLRSAATTGNFELVDWNSTLVRFSVTPAGRVNMSALPTSATGLSSGDLWIDTSAGRVIKVVA
jgi:hypothetical protein